MSNTLHLVLYSDGEPFDSTKIKLKKTIKKFTKRNVIIHDYNLNRMKKSSWYHKVEELPDVKGGVGKRDGYYCVYKAFCPYEVYQNMKKGDILYYVDSSKYFKTGFTESVDKLCDIVLKEGIIAGSAHWGLRNKDKNCCNNLDVWNKILPNNDNSKLLDKPHILASWFILTKNGKNTHFMKDWVYWCMYKDDDLTNPLITYHHTVDQSIFNILVNKYNFKIFYDKHVAHGNNKNRNIALNKINNDTDTDRYFIHIKDFVHSAEQIQILNKKNN